MEVGKTDEELLVESKQEKVGQETFQQQSNKLGFSIAQIMGFYGKKPQPNTDEERPRSPQIAISQRSQQSSASSSHHQPTLSTQPPKLWRPQPFRDFSASGSQQSTR